MGTVRWENDLLDRFLIRLTLHRPAVRPAAPIDRLEGFRPCGHSMYQLVMVAVLCGRTSIPAWVHWMPRIDTGIRLGSGVWY